MIRRGLEMGLVETEERQVERKSEDRDREEGGERREGKFE